MRPESAACYCFGAAAVEIIADSPQACRFVMIPLNTVFGSVREACEHLARNSGIQTATNMMLGLEPILDFHLCAAPKGVPGASPNTGHVGTGL